MAELTTLESLLEMGFGRNRAEKAVANTGNQGIEQAMDWLEELMRVKQAERRERERAEEVEREKQRRRQGQELQQIRQKIQDDEMKKLADQRRREKMEDKLARLFGGGAASSTVTPAQPTPPSPSSPTGQGPPPTKKEYDESRIQVRLLDGSTINTVFKAQEPLAAVRVYVQVNGNTPEGQDFTLLSPYPRHVYTEMDMEKPLKELGLVPSAVLVVAKKGEGSAL
uniref:UBX domain protein 1 n=1 Tax=Cyprinodon variegatus TaxID=28743 RepID=A0A3Q2E2V0_CYPVA